MSRSDRNSQHAGKRSGKSTSKRGPKNASPKKGYPRPRPEGRPQKAKNSVPKYNDTGLVRLNKFIANAGICSRREADELILAGVISVNGKVVTELGLRVGPNDGVKYGDQTIRAEKSVYLVLNKPKDFITTLDDPMNRRTVMSLVSNACKERIFPVGRLDRNTTGLLLFTNDGDLAKILTHPKHLNKKIYHVYTDKNVKREDLEKIQAGFQLDDGFIKADAVSYVGDQSKQIGIELHSGRNRIVRRIFEHFGYNVKKLDRVFFAGLTKKDLPRGKWRFLTEDEINILKRGVRKVSEK